MTADPAPQPERLGAYRIESVLGSEGAATVYLAYDERRERHVAVKRFRLDGKLSAEQRERFRREARVAARLSHPAIVEIYEILEGDDGDWVVREYVEGTLLSDLIAWRELDVRQIVALGRELADGLAAAHAEGLVHRDLRSKNVIVTATGRPKILDLGLVLPLWRGEKEPGKTIPSTLVDSVRAMAPEQAAGATVDHRADLFSFGVLLYEMASGRSPFRGVNVVDTLHKVAHEEPTPLLELEPELPPALCDLVVHLLEKDPGKRPASARLAAEKLAEVSTALSAAVAAQPRSEGAPPPSPAGARALEVVEDAAARSVIRVLVLVDLVDSTKMVEQLGDVRAVEVARRHDRLARDLLGRHDGLEIDKTDGFLLLFERAVDAVAFALDYQQGVVRLSQELDVEIQARTGIHLGEVFLQRNRPEDVARGAKPVEVEGLAKPVAARIMALASGHQVLLSNTAFDLARRGAVGGRLADANLEWLAHGPYLFKGVEEPIEIFEVGVKGFAPLQAPPDSEKARRAVAVSEELTLGWRPAVRQTIPHRANWRLDERLGEGRFGEVWLASHQATGEQRVFKFCFLAERLRALQREVTIFRLLKEALGHRDDIARVLDWNFDEAPYFLEAEYTEGGSLAAWSAEQGGLAAVPLATRLELLAQVAEALAAAHSVGVLHKDVKPENVLIRTEADGELRVRLTGFGIGHLTGRDSLAAQSLAAEDLTEIAPADEDALGTATLRFMAPELIEGRPATIQADIYSLGVMLYQMVVGDFSRALAPGWRREVEDELLREDIALLVDGVPERRPANAGVLAERLRALDERRAALAAERRAARAAEETRQAAEVARRTRRLVAAVAAVLLVVLSILAIQAALGRRQADRLRGQAEDLISFMLGDLRRKLEPVGRLDVLDSVGDKALDYFASLDAADVTETSRARHAEALQQIGEVRIARGDLDGALEVFRQALSRSQSLAASAPGDPEKQLAVGFGHFWIGYVLSLQGELAAALPEFEAYLEISRRLAERRPDDAKYLLELGDAHSNVGSVKQRLGRVDAAIEHLRLELEIKQRLAKLEPERADWQAKLASSHRRIGQALREQGDLGGALTHLRANLEIVALLTARDPADTTLQEDLALGHSWMAAILGARGETEEALTHGQRYLELAADLAALDPANSRWRRLLSVAHLKVGEVLAARGDRQRGLPRVTAAVDLGGELANEDPSNALVLRHLADARSVLARLLLAAGDAAGALRQADEARDLLAPLVAETEKGRDSETGVVWSRNALIRARALTAQRDFERARATWEQAAAAIEPFAEGSRDYRFLAPWAIANLELGRVEKARPAVVTLLAMGYEDRDFAQVCAAHGLTFPTPSPDDV